MQAKQTASYKKWKHMYYVEVQVKDCSDNLSVSAVFSSSRIDPQIWDTRRRLDEAIRLGLPEVQGNSWTWDSSHSFKLIGAVELDPIQGKVDMSNAVAVLPELAKTKCEKTMEIMEVSGRSRRATSERRRL